MTPTTMLGKLIDQLHEVNCQISETTRPLNHLDDLNFQEREQLRAQLRADWERWEHVTQKIDQVLAKERQ